MFGSSVVSVGTFGIFPRAKVRDIAFILDEARKIGLTITAEDARAIRATEVISKQRDHVISGRVGAKPAGKAYVNGKRGRMEDPLNTYMIA